MIDRTVPFRDRLRRTTFRQAYAAEWLNRFECALQIVD